MLVRLHWSREVPPKHCGGCGSVLWTEVVEKKASPRFDRMTGVDLGPKFEQVAYCQTGMGAEFKDPDTAHEYWTLPDGVEWPPNE